MSQQTGLGSPEVETATCFEHLSWHGRTYFSRTRDIFNICLTLEHVWSQQQQHMTAYSFYSALTSLDFALLLCLPCHLKLRELINDILNVKCQVLSPSVSLSSFTLSSLSFIFCLLVSLISFVVFDVIANLDHLNLFHVACWLSQSATIWCL